MAWYSGTMIDDAEEKNHWLEKIDESEANAGDIMIVNSRKEYGMNGHVGILLEKYGGVETRMVYLDEKHGVSETIVGQGFGDLLNEKIVFARALKN